MLMVLCSALRLLFSHGAVTFEELFLFPYKRCTCSFIELNEFVLKHLLHLSLSLSLSLSHTHTHTHTHILYQVFREIGLKYLYYLKVRISIDSVVSTNFKHFQH